jgi:hypothetical protein
LLGVENQLGAAQSVSLVDLENDGFLDIFVINRGGNKFYHNQSGRSFVDIAPQLGLDDPEGALGEYSAWADYDRDGDMDLLLARARLPGQERRWCARGRDRRREATSHGFTEGVAWGTTTTTAGPISSSRVVASGAML